MRASVTIFVFVLVVEASKIANNPMKSTPGVIKSDLGKVSFAQDYVTVKLNMRPISDF